MKPRTSEDYSKELKAWYAQHRNELHAGLLVEPSNKELRSLCISLLRIGLSVSDDKIFRDFFEVGATEDLHHVITRFDIEKFRPIANFLNGASQTKDRTRLNLIAVLIDFPDRPLSRFLQSAKPETRAPGTSTTTNADISEAKPQRRNHNLFWIAGVAMIAVLVILLVRKTQPESCMVWKKNHYEKVSCQDSTHQRGMVEPIDLKQFKVKKITVSKNSVFFVKGRPKIWYVRHDNRYEFFSAPGFHPKLKDRALKPVTTYIAMKVVSGEIKGN